MPGISRDITDRTSLGEQQQPTVPNHHATITATGRMLSRWLGEHDLGRLISIRESRVLVRMIRAHLDSSVTVTC